MKVVPISLTLVFFIFSGATHASNAYNPVTFNLSTLFDFNPVKGPIKELKTIMKNRNGDEVYNLNMLVSEDGCVQSVEIKDSSQGFVLSLKKEASELKGIMNDKPLAYMLDSKCNVTSSTGAFGDLGFKNDSNGLIKDILSANGKISSHFYDENRNLIKTEFYVSGKVASSNSITYPDANKMPLDYTLVNENAYSGGYSASSKCQYDDRKVPVKCIIKTHQEKDKPDAITELTVFTEASFY
jgi:hypothetical protein